MKNEVANILGWGLVLIAVVSHTFWGIVNNPKRYGKLVGYAGDSIKRAAVCPKAILEIEIPIEVAVVELIAPTVQVIVAPIAAKDSAPIAPPRKKPLYLLALLLPLPILLFSNDEPVKTRAINSVSSEITGIEYAKVAVTKLAIKPTVTPTFRAKVLPQPTVAVKCQDGDPLCSDI